MTCFAKSCIFSAALGVALSFWSTWAEVPSQIVAEGVPDIPRSLEEDTGPYLDYRTAQLQSWSPATGGILIMTRFGETRQLHEVSEPGGARRQLSFRSEPVMAAGYNPVQGDVLLAAQDVGGVENYQIFRIKNGRWNLLTDGESRNTDVVFSDDGRLIGYTSTRRTGKDSDLWMMDPRNPASNRIVAKLKGPGWRFLDFAPNGSRALVQKYITSSRSILHVLDLETEKLDRITPEDRGDIGYASAEYGPDGRLYVITDQDSAFMRLVVLDEYSGDIQPLSPEAPWDVEAFDVAPDGSFIVFSLNEAGISHLYQLDLGSGKMHKITIPTGVVGSLLVSPWNETGFTLSAADAPSDVYSVSRQGELKRWTYSETGGLDTAQFAKPELVQVEGQDGLELSGFLYRPDAHEFPGSRPLVMVVHGGPAAQSRPGFLGRHNYLIDVLGVALFFPNVRGSTGYGKEFVALDDGKLREDSLKDLGVFLRQLARDPMIDASRIGVSGGSYSGYLVLRALADYGDLLRAGMVVSGITNFVTFLENTKAYRRDLRRAEYGDEREPDMRAFLTEISPITRVDDILRPVLIISGQNDPRVPLSESAEMVDALRDRGIPAWHIAGLNEGHGFRKKENRDYQFLASILFWKKFLISEIEH